MGILPGQLAFFILLSLVPIVTLASYIAGLFEIKVDSVLDMLGFIPGAVELLVPNFKGGLGLGFIIIFIWMFYIATNGCNTIILISNQIYGINQSTWLKRRIKAIFMTLMIVLLIIFMLIFPVFSQNLLEMLKEIPGYGLLINIYSIAYPIFSILVIYVFLRVFYNFAPDRVRDKTNIGTGAFVTSIGWYLITLFYSYTSHNMVTYNLLYSSLSNLALLMIWLYFISYMFVLGLALNYGEELHEKESETGIIKVIKNK
jgi:membrane protein